jgi:ubiquinone/menaquinone biosynthesis C-methylase UbiE
MTRGSPTPEERARLNQVKRVIYANEAAKYGCETDFFERRILGTEHRGWACSQARGSTLEVAIGTGLNLPHYPTEVRLTGLDLTPEMLAVAQARAKQIGRRVAMMEGDAHDLPFADETFETVVCTYSLCSVPDVALAIAEMKRVLQPGGRLILVDHTRSTFIPIFWLQWLMEFIPSRTKGEYMTRRPALQVMAAGFEIETHDRLRAGVVERLVAVKTV